jgi:HAD superfamily hydrolase (TIGR01549 family)
LQKPIKKQELNELLSNFSKEVKKALLVCEVAKNIKELKEKTQNLKWLIVSGGDQAELREIFKQKGLNNYFDGGIFGSPDNKDTILKNEMERRNITGKSLFIGDSMYDYQAATKAKMDFVFLSRWSDVPNLKEKFIGRNFLDISELCNTT